MFTIFLLKNVNMQF